jgi:Ca2+-binding EF-hand superfamily protein
VNTSEEFLKKDTNQDFKLSQAEFVAKRKDQQKAEVEKRFQKLDRDGNGHLTLSEFKSRQAPGKKK